MRRLIVLLLAWSWNLYQNIARSHSPSSFERQVSIQVDVDKSFSVDQKRDLYDRVYQTLEEHQDELEIEHVSHSFRRSAGRARRWSRRPRLPSSPSGAGLPVVLNASLAPW